MNTIGNCLVLDTETESALISPKGGFGGIGGGFTKPIALANVYQLRQRLDPSINLVGVGGVRTGEDAFQLILCGADAVQTATTHWLEGPACFDRIATELSAIMTAKGYSSIGDFKGKLKAYDKTNKPKDPPEANASASGKGFSLNSIATIFNVVALMFMLASFLVTSGAASMPVPVK